MASRGSLCSSRKLPSSRCSRVDGGAARNASSTAPARGRSPSTSACSTRSRSAAARSDVASASAAAARRASTSPKNRLKSLRTQRPLSPLRQRQSIFLCALWVSAFQCFYVTDFDLPPRTARELGWPELLGALAARTATDLGRARALATRALDSREECERSFAEIEEARTLVRTGLELPLHGVRDVRPALSRAGRGGVLEPAALLEIAALARAAARRARCWAREASILRACRRAPRRSTSILV